MILYGKAQQTLCYYSFLSMFNETVHYIRYHIKLTDKQIAGQFTVSFREIHYKFSYKQFALDACVACLF